MSELGNSRRGSHRRGKWSEAESVGWKYVQTVIRRSSAKSVQSADYRPSLPLFPSLPSVQPNWGSGTGNERSHRLRRFHRWGKLRNEPILPLTLPFPIRWARESRARGTRSKNYQTKPFSKMNLPADRKPQMPWKHSYAKFAKRTQLETGNHELRAGMDFYQTNPF
jgi:hypothetical protein